MKESTSGALLTALAVAGGAALLMLTGAGNALAGNQMVTVKAGKRYRFFFKVTPAVPRSELNAALGTLTLMGANSIDTSSSADETRISYELTPTVTKDVVLNTPMVEFGNNKLIPIKIQEMP